MAAADVTANWMGCCGPATIANDPLMRGLTNSSAESIVGIFGVLCFRSLSPAGHC